MQTCYLLEGLGCANCAAKMEADIRKLPQVVDAQINFVNKTLYLTADEPAVVLPMITTLVQSIEPEVRVVAHPHAQTGDSDGAHGHDHAGLTAPLWRLALSAGLALTALLVPLPALLALVLYVTAYLVAGMGVLHAAARGIMRGDVFNENFLMSIATIGAFALGEYLEGVGVMFFFLIGEMLQDRAVDKSRRSIAGLMNIRPDHANRYYRGQVTVVSPDMVQPGEHILVKVGERIPLDGTVIEGSSRLDTSALTGESLPQSVGVGDAVLSGAVNESGVLILEVQKPYGESTVARILNLVEQSAARKAPTEQFITTFARYYTPVVVFAALAIALLPPLLWSDAGVREWTSRALIFLVVSCPCALVISIPLSYFAGLGAASKAQILIKGGNYLEALAETKTVVFDKTGTLTKGVFQVLQVDAAEGYQESDVLQAAAVAERYSDHPLAQSVRKAAPEPMFAMPEDGTYQEFAGEGVAAAWQDRRLLAGNSRLLARFGVAHPARASVGSFMYVAKDDAWIGTIEVGDAIKEGSTQVVAALQQIGVQQTVMLTGDRREAAERLAEHIGIGAVQAELLPGDKVDTVETLMQQNSSGKLAFVGDGINDAPVLARADVGIAMGGIGSDAAIEAADVVLMNDDPRKVAEAIQIAKRTRRIAYQNVVLALGVKGFFLVLAALGMATMWEAVFADVGVALLAIMNAMRALRHKGTTV